MKSEEMYVKEINCCQISCKHVFIYQNFYNDVCLYYEGGTCGKFFGYQCYAPLLHKICKRLTRRDIRLVSRVSAIKWLSCSLYEETSF